MARLTAAKRKDIPDDKFALPKERKYPIENRAHAANAKSRATQMERDGKLTKSQEKRVDAAADRVLRGKKVKR